MKERYEISPYVELEINPHAGLFIDIEGLDGSGQTTQVELLTEKLRRKGLRVYTTKEPTDNVIGGQIRGALTGVFKLPPDTLQLLFVADRGHHRQREIIPILKDCSVLIADRYLWSTIAFGSINLDRDWLISLHKYCFLPDLTFFLKVAPDECLRRKKEDKFAFELFEKKKELEEIWKNYEWLAENFSQTIKTIDGENSKEAISQEILKAVCAHPKFASIKRI